MLVLIHAIVMCWLFNLNRFGRNKKEIKDEWQALIDERIDIVVLNMPILSTR